jgi:multimeric flavodoxin WrbA
LNKKHLLIVFHSQSGRSERLAFAAFSGAKSELDVETRLCRAIDADSADMLWADGLIIVTPENFGAASGGIKDFFDRIYYPLERAEYTPRPYALIISAGNDGSGCERQLERILIGLKGKKIQETTIVYGDPQQEQLLKCSDSGLAMASGLSMGIY